MENFRNINAFFPINHRKESKILSRSKQFNSVENGCYFLMSIYQIVVSIYSVNSKKKSKKIHNITQLYSKKHQKLVMHVHK